MTEERDIVVVGGGLVGASLAIALDGTPHAVTMIEAGSAPPATAPSYGERNLALARASVNGLGFLGVWPHVREQATPIKRLNVTRAGAFGSLRVTAAELGLDSLGHSLPARQLGAGLQRALESCHSLERLAPARVSGIERSARGWKLTVGREGGTLQLDTRLLVAADGGRSQLREWLGIPVSRHDYGQTLFVATVTPEKPMDGCAFERFTDSGPVAMVPLADGRGGLVLAVDSGEADAAAELDDDAFLALAQRRFGGRLGRLRRPGPRHRHLVPRVAAEQVVAPRAVLVGNAAQTIHPIGAQGFNLGLRDALTLAELLAAAPDPGEAGVLQAYSGRRRPDREAVMSMSHALVRLACLDEPALAPLQSLALLALGIGPLKQDFARRGMGFRGRPPRAVLETLP